jgi:hypothetical protein
VTDSVDRSVDPRGVVVAQSDLDVGPSGFVVEVDARDLAGSEER